MASYVSKVPRWPGNLDGLHLASKDFITDNDTACRMYHPLASVLRRRCGHDTGSAQRAGCSCGGAVAVVWQRPGKMLCQLA